METVHHLPILATGAASISGAAAGAEEALTRAVADGAYARGILANEPRWHRILRLLRRLPPACKLAAVAFWLVAVLLRWGVAPYFEQLPKDHVASADYQSTSRARQSPTSPVEEYNSIVHQREQTLTSSAGVSIIQAGSAVTTPAGVLVYELFDLYGVDRATRQNVPGYGNRDRTGQFLFPRHLEKKQYRLWNPFYAGPCLLTFDREEYLQGIKVYRFSSRCIVDDTVGYEALPDVPEKYGVTSDGRDRYWVEPVSGTVLDHRSHGTSYFVDRNTGRRAGDATVWQSRYSPKTIQAQVRQATVTRRWMMALEMWLPLLLAMAGLAIMIFGLRGAKGQAR